MTFRRALTLWLTVALCPVHFVQSESLAETKHLFKHLIKAFSQKRSNEQPEQKVFVRGYIRDFFGDLASQNKYKLLEHHFDVEWDNTTGINFMLILPGELYNTPEDHLTLMTTHYDSVPQSPGVDDNGSSMSALLEAARVLSTLSNPDCPRKNSVGFVAFDLEEQHLLGSKHFVNEFLVPLLFDLGLQSDHFEGTINLDTVMNWDDAPNTQDFPDGMDALFPELYNIAKQSKFAGNFMNAISRLDDNHLANQFSTVWNSLPLGSSHKVLPIPLPFSGRPLDLGHEQRWAMIDFLRSDHTSFWNYEGNYTQTGLKGIFLTDSAQFRGIMKTCYHQECDDISQITDGKMQFLAKLTETCIRLLFQKATGQPHDSCLSPTDGWDLNYNQTTTDTSSGLTIYPDFTIVLFIVFKLVLQMSFDV